MIAQSMLGELDYEMANTRKTLERVPENKLDWKPDPKSMSMAQLAGHIVEMVGWGSAVLTTPSMDMGAGEHKPFIPTSVSELLSAFDKNLSGLKAALAGASEEDMMKTWTLSVGSNVIFSMPRVAVMRTMIMNHLVHHRAQLTVYYRLNGVSVPALYGPSADEGQMTASA